MMKSKCLCGQCTATIKSSTMFNWWRSSLFLVSCFEVYLSSEKSVIGLTSRLAGKLCNNFFAWQVKGMNALFGLHLQISVGESLIVGTAVSRFGCFYCCLLYILHCSNFKWRNNAYESTCWCIAIVIKLLEIVPARKCMWHVKSSVSLHLLIEKIDEPPSFSLQCYCGFVGYNCHSVSYFL